jgi:glutamate-ammonia-ligase adenylyltransferase
LNSKKQNSKVSKIFITDILGISGGYFTPDQLDKIFHLLEEEINKFNFPDSSEANLLRIINGMYNKRAFLEECLQYPHYVEIIIAISANSNYLTDILVRDPEYFYWIVNPSTLKLKLELNSFSKSLENTLLQYNSLKAKLNALRAIKRKEILRIGLRDILKVEDLKTITEELSVLAKSIASTLFNTCYKEILNKYQVRKLNRKYCLIALGKLGGNELNYSSDIDLIIFYDKNTRVTDKINYQEFLTEVILLFIESAASITNTGYIYRVDFRLRPDGKNSPLCNTYNSYINYYESRGEDWERQMLIKTDFICGNENLFSKFSNYLSHFIYPGSFSVSPLEQIKKLKYAIEKKLKDEENIKLASGGIRNIEFSVQALQLLNGGRFQEIRTPNTLDAICKLKEKNLLTEKESVVFIEAYTFYRKVEHYLQLMNDTQTHTIPHEGTILNNLSYFLGFNSPEAFQKKVASYRNSVLDIYNSIVGSKEKKDEEKHEARLVFRNKIKAEKNLSYLRTGRGLLDQKQFDKKTTLAFIAIEGHLFDYMADSKYPDIILENFTRIIRNVSFPSMWYTEFMDQKFFDAFLTICEYSQKSVDLFAEDEDLREYFITKKIFGKLNAEMLGNLNTKTFLFHLLCLFTLKIIGPKKISSLLKSFFVGKIKYLSDTSLKVENKNYFIAALGSFGSGEMSFASDIDLIFVVEKSDKSNNIGKEFQTFLLKLKKEFLPFDVDCRLRPEGTSSQLVWEFDSYKKYLSKRARTWEFQAFCKLNMVSGNRNLFNKFSRAIRRDIANLDKKILKKNILEMRNKLYPPDLSGLTEIFNIKKSRGGITDIEFILQYLMLSNHKYYFLLKGERDEQIIVKLSNVNKSISTRKDNLIEGYYFLKKLELANQNIFNVSNSQIILESGTLNRVLTFLELGSHSVLKNHLSKITKLNHTLFEILLKEK